MKNKVIIQGILWDDKSSFSKGPAQAPPKIREALNSGASNYYSENGTLINGDQILDKGDFKIEDYFEIETITSNNTEKSSKLLTLGGDHSISYPVIKALCKNFSKIDILHIDAHSDLYDNYEGDPYSHACPFARIMELGIVDRLVQVGIRTLNPHQLEQAKQFGVEIHPMNDLRLDKISEFKNPLYISLDIDAFDPAFAPGISHLESGGLTARDVIGLIQNLRANVFAADIVEYNPLKDINDITAYLAAKMYKEIIAKMLA
ncbi:MAG: agmatinase [Flavobacteriaceae bacterium]|nr:agmatinase [Flavobacteriaceae bacterium]